MITVVKRKLDSILILRLCMIKSTGGCPCEDMLLPCGQMPPYKSCKVHWTLWFVPEYAQSLRDVPASAISKPKYFRLPAAINSAMADSYRSPSNVTGICDANHCEWEACYTLAMCTTIEDVSSRIQSVYAVNLGDPHLQWPSNRSINDTTF
jgi:hypothetical protein